MQDGLRSDKEEGGDVLVCMEKYHNIIDQAAENMSEDERKLMQTATGDDGDILVRIVVVAFVPESEANILDVADDMFYIYDNRQELFITQVARCLGTFRAFLEEYFTELEAKHGRVTIKVMIQVFYLNPIIRDSKGDVVINEVINECNRNFQQTGKYQIEGMDWRMMKPVVEDYMPGIARRRW